MRTNAFTTKMGRLQVISPLGMGFKSHPTNQPISRAICFGRKDWNADCIHDSVYTRCLWYLI